MKKISRYTNFIPYEGKVIVHNGMSNEYLLLEPVLHELLQTSLHEEKGVESLKEVHPDFYKHLIKKGFIVEDNIDELEECIKKLHQFDSNDTRYELHINPTMNCNFKCWYCYETHIKQSKMSEKTIEKVVLFAQNILENKPKLQTFQVNWFGGEPLLYFDKVVLPLTKKIQKLCENKNIAFISLITTNGLLINDTVIKNAPELKLLSFQITLDGHRERHNQVRFISKNRGSYDEIVNNIKKLVKSKIRVTVRINCSKETLEGLEKIADDFVDISREYRQYITFDFHEVWQIEEKLTKPLNQYIALFREKEFKVWAIDMHYFGLSCYADRINQANINYNGDVYKCTARDYTKENREGILNEKGEIIWNEKYEKRFERKYANKPCLECSIFPICSGGCSQISLEKDNYCIYDFDENRKKEVILSNFLASIQ